MALAYTVHADSKPACATALNQLCAALGLDPSMAPVRQPGTERWIARAATPRHDKTPPDNPDGAPHS